MLEVPDWGLASWYWFWYGHWSLIYPWSEFWLSILILKVQRISMSFMSWFLALEDAEGSWLGFVSLILIFDMVPGLWYTHVPILDSLSLFWRCKEHPCPLSPDLGIWRTLEVPDWGLLSWSWLGYGHWSLIDPSFELWLSIMILILVLVLVFIP